MYNNKIVKLFFLITALNAHAELRIILTAALSENQFSEFRKQQYIESFQLLSRYGYENVYVVEALKKHGPTYLDLYSKNVFYSSANNPKYKNYGINEFATLLEILEYHNFNPEDVIVKITGRYQLISDHLLKFASAHTEYDAVVKFEHNGHNMFTSAFAIKCKHLISMIKSLNYEQMEKEWIIAEDAAARYIRKQISQGLMNVYQIDSLGIKANFYGSSWPGRSGIEFQ